MQKRLLFLFGGQQQALSVSVHSLLVKTTVHKSGKTLLPLLENQMPLSPWHVIQSRQHFSHASPSAVFQ